MKKKLENKKVKQPLRGKILPLEGLFKLGEELAKTQKFEFSPKEPSKIVSRFEENAKFLTALHRSFIELDQDYSFLPATEWFIDNFYVIREHLKDCRSNLPNKGYPELPKLKEGKRKGYPRIYEIAEKFLIHSDAKFDLENFYELVRGYQSEDGLTTKELWILPMMLRLAFVENLKRLGARVKRVQEEQQKANYWAKRILKEKNIPHKKQGETFKELTSTHADPSPAFALQMLERLYDQGENIIPLLKWFKRNLSQKGLTVQSAITKERQRQAANQISVTNTIDSMRHILTLEWKKIVEKLSHLEKILKNDPSGHYPRMDFKSRNRYRTSIQNLADNTNLTEREVAKVLIKLAEKQKPGRRKHIGYWLVGEGKKAFEENLNYKPTRKEKTLRFLYNHSKKVYFGGIASLTTLCLGFLLSLTGVLGGDARSLLLVAAVGIVPASEIAVNTLHLAAGKYLPPKLLPKLEFKDKIPEEHSTILVVPAFLRSKQEIEELIQRLEVHHLANKAQNLNFGLLLDYKDASKKKLPSDDELLDFAKRKIKKINEKYPSEFFILIRERKWNPRENLWMGWERKRGKLREFNRFLLGQEKGKFSVFGGDKKIFSKIKYVITLDQDTRLPKNEGLKLIGAMSHPLNRPVLNESRVVKGYSILQPKLQVSIKKAVRSPLAYLFSGPKGLDPYTGLVSDIYQDLFQEGRYMGKGIYDVEAFEKVLGDKFQENLFLSHDHVEGFLSRTGLVSDLEAFEDFPSDYYSFSLRKNRWQRGDFQLSGWLGGTIKNKKGEKIRNPLPPIGKWVLFNNMRKHLVPLFNLAFLLLGWFLFPRDPWIWTLFILLEIGFFSFTNLVQEAVNRSIFPDFKDGWRGCTRTISAGINWMKKLASSLKRLFMEIVLLPHQAAMAAKSVLQVLIRKNITKRKLLQWTTASQVKKSDKNSPVNLAWFMKNAILIGSFCFALSLIKEKGVATLSLSLLWILSPFFAWRMGKEKSKRVKISQKKKKEIRRLARKNWRFFDDFVGTETNFLPPDTYQNTPQKRVAWRTSPTNIGFFLLSALSARNLGYISTLKLLNILEQTLSSLEKMKKYRGHLYNWHSVKNLEPLPPPYISSVDSGNLAASLIIVKSALQEIKKNPFPEEKITRGIEDSFLLLKEMLEGGKAEKHLKALEKSIHKKPNNGWLTYFKEIKKKIFPLRSLLEEKKKEKGKSLRLEEASYWLKKLSAEVDGFYYERDGLTSNKKGAIQSLKKRSNKLAAKCDKLVEEMEFKFLYDEKKKLFSLGWRVDKKSLDKIYYNFLGSESRLASFTAIAKGDIPIKHWFGMARNLVEFKNKKAVVSWGGSLYEYLMPNLMLESYPGTLLHETSEVAVKKHINYARKKKVPWGMSESAYNVQNLEGFYRYKVFGAPELGVKHSLDKEVVVSPYSTLLALPRFPKKSIKNLKRLKKEGLEGKYGFYDAVDYTTERVPAEQKGVVIPTYFSHHKSLSLMAIDACLNQNPISDLLFRDPRVKSVEHYLQEETPHQTPVLELQKFKKSRPSKIKEEKYGFSPVTITEPYQKEPSSFILSNGKYQVMIDEAGSGYSKFQKLFLTRFREDPTKREYGTFFYIKDCKTEKVWSATFQPTRKKGENWRMLQHENKVEFLREDYKVETKTEIVVPSRENAEIRRITITNQSSKAKELEITSYGKIAMSQKEQDLSHPTFSDMFVSSNFLKEKRSLIFHRKARTEKESPLWATHTVAGGEKGTLQYTTDKKGFVGRGNTLKNPKALKEKLDSSKGNTLNPIMSLRVKVKLAPGEKRKIAFTNIAAFNREEALSLAEKYSKMNAVDRAVLLQESYGQLEMRQLAFSPEENLLFQKLASRILWPKGKLKNEKEIIKNKKKKNDLWGYSISGDHPIVLVTASKLAHLPLIRQITRAQKFWRRKGFVFDIVILNEEGGGYKKELEEKIGSLSRNKVSGVWAEEQGSIFTLRSDLVPKEDQTLIKAVARVTLKGERGSFKDQIEKEAEVFSPPSFKKVPKKETSLEELVDTKKLRFYNHYGGFDEESEEYVITLREGKNTPAPWTNVIANPEFGFIISESGSQFTFHQNSKDNRLTPWLGDSISNPCGEALYIKDEKTGKFWSPTPWPRRSKNPYLIRHGKGYTKFEHKSNGISSKLTLFADSKDPVKAVRLKIKNNSSQKRELSLYYFAEWVLGELRSKTWPHLVTEINEGEGLVTARNPLSENFSGMKAFLWSKKPDSLTGDREKLLGPLGEWENPIGLTGEKLVKKEGAKGDPGAGIQKRIILSPEEEKEVVFLLGQTENKEEVKRITEKYKTPERVKKELQRVNKRWKKVTSSLKVETPEKSLDILLNQWINYQTLSCRVWSRSSFYQPGGAYGFRDQLQDVMSLGLSRPEIIKEHILRACKRQYQDGGVQHWWKEKSGIGLRSSYVDDPLWLVYLTAYYVNLTNDWEILEEEIRFLEKTNSDFPAEKTMEKAFPSNEKATLFEHCLRAVEKSFDLGPHGLPRIKGGDWNDGMNKVGIGGQGESVWMAWFQMVVFERFLKLAKKKGEKEVCQRLISCIKEIEKGIERSAWDGEWYKRAYFDNGTPLGSKTNKECSITLTPQAWAMIWGKDKKERLEKAQKSCEKHLVKRKEKLIKLLDPPFKNPVRDPGYIKNYPPGVRENGACYVHASMFYILGLLSQGKKDKAFEIFSWLNPIERSSSKKKSEEYQLEPYVSASDIYTGKFSKQGGWSWYTGSASWIWRVAVEFILGLKVEGDGFKVKPHVPSSWEKYKLTLKHRSDIYAITVYKKGKKRIEVNGKKEEGNKVAFRNDGETHRVNIYLGN